VAVGDVVAIAVAAGIAVDLQAGFVVHGSGPPGVKL
jgi:hypothetical protein